MATLLVLLPPRDPGVRSEEWQLPDLPFLLLDKRGRALRTGSSALVHLPRASATVLLIAARDLLMLSAKVPPIKGPRLRQILPNLIEDQLIQDPLTCHVALDPAPAVDGRQMVAVIDRSWFRFVCDAFTDAGHHTLRAVPVSRCLPMPQLAPGAVLDLAGGADSALDAQGGRRGGHPARHRDRNCCRHGRPAGHRRRGGSAGSRHHGRGRIHRPVAAFQSDAGCGRGGGCGAVCRGARRGHAARRTRVGARRFRRGPGRAGPSPGRDPCGAGGGRAAHPVPADRRARHRTRLRHQRRARGRWHRGARRPRRARHRPRNRGAIAALRHAGPQRAQLSFQSVSVRVRGRSR